MDNVRRSGELALLWMFELPIKSSDFTWSRSSGEAAIYKWLDRGLVFSSWMNLFVFSYEEHLTHIKGEPVLIWFIQYAPKDVQGCKLFRFEDVWLSSSLCRDIVQSEWGSLPSVSV